MSDFNRRARPRVEYVNRAGDPVNPITGRPLFVTTFKNKDMVINSRIPYPNVLGKSQYPKFLTRDGRRGSKKNRQPLPVKLRGAIFGNLDSIMTDPRIDPPPHHCFNCWQKGHDRSECPRPFVSSYCVNCGRRGVEIAMCPRCSRSYLRNHKNRVFNDLEMRNDESNADDVLQDLIYKDEERRHEKKTIKNTFQEQESNDKMDSSHYSSLLKWNYRDNSPYYQEYENINHNIDGSSSHSRERSPNFRSSLGRFYSERQDHSSLLNRNHFDYRKNTLRQQREGSFENSNNEGNYSKFTNMDDNPVQEMLALIKSIAHLPADTQEMIVRQVTAERQYKLQLLQKKKDEVASWPL